MNFWACESSIKKTSVYDFLLKIETSGIAIILIEIFLSKMLIFIILCFFLLIISIFL